jgi:hypothetical protein
MAFFDFLGNLGQKAQDAAQNIPGADAVGQVIGDPGAAIGDAAQNIPGADAVGQTVSDAGAGIGDAAQNVAGGATDQLSNLTDKLPKF